MAHKLFKLLTMRTSVMLCLYILQFIIIQQMSCASPQRLPEDATLDFEALATKYGHPPTRFQVVTEDEYILTLYRLPGASSTPVLLVHGLLDSSDTWMIKGNTSLAIALANRGHDVWLANARGNRYSRRHKHLDPDADPAFWSYSFHEIGRYDLPAIIDTVLNETGASNVSAIGHSQGTTVFYVLGSERPEYNSKVNVLISLAPVAYLHNTPPPISTAIRLTPAIDAIIKRLDINEMFGDNTTVGSLLHTECSKPYAYTLCRYTLFLIMGFDEAEMEQNILQIGAKHYPAGSSARSLLHYLQIGYRQIFARYKDINYENEVEVKNSNDPPVYRLDRVTMPIALLAARNDHLSSIPDVELLRRQLPNVVYYKVNPRSMVNHVDYVMGRNSQTYLYPYLYRLLNKKFGR